MALMRLPSGTTVSSAYMKLLLGAGVFLLLASELFPQEPKAAPQCAAVTLRISLKAGDTFQRPINGLTFRVRATKDAGSCYGWWFFLEDAAGHDFIYPVNPPLRFNPSQLLGCGYGESAQQILKWDRELRFVLDQADYEHFDPLVENALWPYPEFPFWLRVKANIYPLPPRVNSNMTCFGRAESRHARMARPCHLPSASGTQKARRRRPLLEIPQPLRQVFTINFASLSVPGYPAGAGNASMRRSIASKSRRVKGPSASRSQ